MATRLGAQALSAFVRWKARPNFPKRRVGSFMSSVVSGYAPVRVPVFAGLPPASPRRWRCFAAAVVLQLILVGVLIHLGVIQPKVLLQKQIAFVPLTAPVPINHAPQHIPAKVMLRAPRIQMQRPPEVAKLEAPPPPKIDVAPEPKPVVPEAKPAVPEVKPEVKTGTFASASNEKPAPKPVPQVTTGAFSTGSSATPTAIMSAKKVQTGGFGDPNGVPANPNSRGGPNTMAKLGSFDMPSGPGSGNGTGGAVGARAVVASAGFGDGVAVGGGGNGRGAAGQVVREAGFADSAPVKTVAATAKAEAPPAQQPVQIEYKPTPAYTTEARQMHIEGDVLVEVTFTADGRVHVKRVVRGLGHGLDEQAVKAAEQIRFKPAMRGGSPVDSTAVLHIVFQIA